MSQQQVHGTSSDDPLQNGSPFFKVGRDEGFVPLTAQASSATRPDQSPHASQQVPAVAMEQTGETKESLSLSPSTSMFGVSEGFAPLTAQPTLGASGWLDTSYSRAPQDIAQGGPKTPPPKRNPLKGGEHTLSPHAQVGKFEGFIPLVGQPSTAFHSGGSSSLSSSSINPRSNDAVS